MKAIILDNVVKSLKEKEESIIFGFKEKQTIIASSLEKRRGLEQIGTFYRNKENLKKGSLREKLVFTTENEKLNCFYFDNDSKEEKVNMQIVNYITDLNKRNHGLIDVSVLQEQTITFIGVVSGGSLIVQDLIRCGVVNINIIDPDDVEISNLCRSVYDLADVGKKKVDALFEKLIRINPCANIQTYDEDVLEMEQDKLDELIKSSDLIIDATDSVKTKLLINGKAYHITPVLYPAVYDLGKGGDILFTIPNITPCFECVFNSIVPQMKEIKKGDWDYTTGKAKPMSGLLPDIKVVTSRTVKLALAILTGDTENSFIEKITEPGCSMLFIGNEKDFSIFDKPFQEVWAETEINPECMCQTLC